MLMQLSNLLIFGLKQSCFEFTFNLINMFKINSKWDEILKYDLNCCSVMNMVEPIYCISLLIKYHELLYNAL